VGEGVGKIQGMERGGKEAGEGQFLNLMRPQTHNGPHKGKALRLRIQKVQETSKRGAGGNLLFMGHRYSGRENHEF